MLTVRDDVAIQMDEVAEGLPTKSEKIRQLAAAGFERAEIARYLGVRYQFVYNVLSAPVPKSKRVERRGPAKSAASTVEGSNEAPATEQMVRWIWTRVGKIGAIELPEAFRRALEIQEGDHVQLVMENDTIRILTREAALNALKDDVRRFVPEGVGLVDALISDRRAEAAGES